MSNLQTPFRYDFVGSFLRPDKLKEARRKFDNGESDYAALKKVEDECIVELVAKIMASSAAAIGISTLCGDLMV